MYHKVFKQGQPQITDFLQTAEQRQGMDAIDKFAKSKARYPLLGMKLNTGAWTTDMLVPKLFEQEYGQDKACSGWHVEINKGEYKLDIHPITKEERKHSEEKNEDKKDQKENIVSKTASQVGGVVKQMVAAGSSVVKQDKSAHSNDSDSERGNSS
jgi:phosphoenolpyruvate synthase/pyruvate phosphate dikinase